MSLMASVPQADCAHYGSQAPPCLPARSWQEDLQIPLELVAKKHTHIRKKYINYIYYVVLLESAQQMAMILLLLRIHDER